MCLRQFFAGGSEKTAASETFVAHVPREAAAGPQIEWPAMTRETFVEAWAAVQAALADDSRQAIASELALMPTLGKALQRLRDCLRSNGFNIAGRHLSFDWFVGPYDRATRREGFHVLNDWDGKSDRVNEDSIPVDVLN